MVKTIKDTVAVGYVHPNTVHEGFAQSLAKACLNPANKIVGIISASNPRQHVARNSVIEHFLEGPAEWLMWIDTDMTFELDAISRLLKTARKQKAQMVAGLAFIFKRQIGSLSPNAFLWNGTDFEDVIDYKDGATLTVDGTGSAFVLIHRDVFKAIGHDWHQNWMHHPANDGPMGHDLAFFYEAVQTHGFKLVYDTNVKTGHIKHFELDEKMFRNYQQGNQDGN